MIADGYGLYTLKMRVDFFKGIWGRGDGAERQDLVVYWAVTPGRIFACSGPSCDPLSDFDPAKASDAELITALDLTGVDDDNLATIVERILQGGYLDRPGVKGKGEAVLYIIVNEALHALKEESDE